MSLIVDEISARVRDSANTAHSRALIIQLLDYCQIIANTSQSWLYEIVPLTLVPGQALYQVETDLPNCTEVESVQIGGRFIDEVMPWRDLHKLSPFWLRKQNQPAGWAKIGRLLLAIYPSPIETTAATVTCKRLTTALVNEADLTEVRLENETVIIDMVTALLLHRQRELEQVPIVVERVNQQLERGQP